MFRLLNLRGLRKKDKWNIAVGPLLTLIVSTINFSVNYFLPKLGLINGAELIKFTEALLFSSSLSSIYFLNRGVLSIRPSLINSIVFAAALVYFFSRIDFFLVTLSVIFILIELYKFHGSIKTGIFQGDKRVLSVLLILCLIIFLTWRDTLVGLGLVYLILLALCSIFLKLPALSFSFDLSNKFEDVYLLVVVVLNQISVYFLLVWTSNNMSEIEFINYRSDLAFLSLGGLVGTLVLTLLMKMQMKGNLFIILSAVIACVVLFRVGLNEFYVPMLVGSSIYHSLNRMYLRTRIFFLVTVPGPVAVILLSLQGGVQYTFSGLALIYGAHMIASYFIHLKSDERWED